MAKRKKNKKLPPQVIQKKRADNNLKKFKEQEQKFGKLLKNRITNPVTDNPNPNNIYDHPKWRALTLRLRQERGRCQFCGYPGNLQTHHIVYISGREIWDYPDFYLVVLCDKCHHNEHKKDFRLPPKIK